MYSSMNEYLDLSLIILKRDYSFALLFLLLLSFLKINQCCLSPSLPAVAALLGRRRKEPKNFNIPIMLKHFKSIVVVAAAAADQIIQSTQQLLYILEFSILALAFCNNSEPQKKRRQILQKFTFPHSHSNMGNYLDTLCLDECQRLVGHLQNAIGSQDAVQIDLKPLIAKACANIFNRYFCSTPRSNYRYYYQMSQHVLDRFFKILNNLAQI